MNEELRAFFDEQLEQVISELPQQVRDLMDKVPVIVEDYPSEFIMRKMGVRHRRGLCGLYTGIPLIHRSVWQSGVPSDTVYLYREGILSTSRRGRGGMDVKKLREQMRVTILHELGHHHGMTESDLRELGYG